MKALWLRLLDWLSRRFGIARTPVPREPITIRPIAVVRNDVRQPRPRGWERVRSSIVVRDDLSEGLDGLEEYSHIIIVFTFDKVPESEQRLRIHIDGDRERGVLATRSQRRPSPLGVTVVKLLRRRANVLWVEGLDAINGTPILDIKPYFPAYDAVLQARVPAWTTGDGQPTSEVPR